MARHRLLTVSGVLALTIGCSGGTGPVTPSSQPTGTGAAADGSTLKVTAPTLLAPPADAQPGGGETVTLVAGPATGRFANVSGLSYRFEVFDSAGARLCVGMGEPTQSGISLALTETLCTLDFDASYTWRVRGELGEHAGPWSATASFLSPPIPLPFGVLPAATCASNSGPAIAHCLIQAYPDRVLAGVSSHQRHDDMAFMRDRFIEAGICGGMDLGWNLKRGGPEISLDFLVWRTPDGDLGMDLALGYDDTDFPLRLHWEESTFPFYLRYEPRPNCTLRRR